MSGISLRTDLPTVFYGVRYGRILLKNSFDAGFDGILGASNHYLISVRRL